MAYINYSVYPNAIDGYSTLPLRRDTIDEIVAADVNRLRDAIVKIEQELGIQPSGSFATVADRLDDIGDAKALILAHMADPTDAHDASAISIEDEDDYYFEEHVEGALEELATLLPPQPDKIGYDNEAVANSGLPSFYDGYGTKFVFNMSSAENVLKRTQPSAISGGVRGVHIFEVGDNVPNGDGYLRLYQGSSVYWVSWKAPGDLDYGTAVNITSLEAGSPVTLSSETSAYKIRITRNSLPLPYGTEGTTWVEHFEVYSLESVSGLYSLPSEGMRSTSFITRTATTKTDESRKQAMISGMVFPADRGKLVLQRKLRGISDYYPVAVLELTDIFDNDLRKTAQKVYTPALEDFDTITLYDRYPVKEDYDTVDAGANGSAPYEDFENDYTRLQVAKYLIPLSNPDIVAGAIDSPDDITEVEAEDNIASYRILHLKDDSTFGLTGNPQTSDLYSASDAWWTTSEHNQNSTVRFSNLYVDTSETRPGIDLVNIRPAGSYTYASLDSTIRSGIKYYYDSSHVFDFEVKSDSEAFNKTYKMHDILTFDTDTFVFPSGTDDGYWGDSVSVTEMLDDGYNKWSDSNLPEFDDIAYYIVDGTTLIDGVATNEARRLYPDGYKFSTSAYITATMHDPFGPGDAYQCFGDIVTYIDRILVNSYDAYRATDTIEYFTDEYRRILDSIEFSDLNELADFDSSDVWGFSGHFDNTANLGSGSLQVGGRFTSSERNVPGLIYPQDDYTTGVSPTNTADYSGYSGDRTYRRMFTLGYPISSGRLRITSGGDSLISFNDIHWENPDRFGKVEIKIPGNTTNSTGWMDITRLFETGQYEDGYGTLYGEVDGEAGDFTVPFTFGTRNSSLSGSAVVLTDSMEYEGHVAVKITYFGTNSTVLAESKQKIMTMMQLLPWNGVM